MSNIIGDSWFMCGSSRLTFPIQQKGAISFQYCPSNHVGEFSKSRQALYGSEDYRAPKLTWKFEIYGSILPVWLMLFNRGQRRNFFLCKQRRSWIFCSCRKDVVAVVKWYEVGEGPPFLVKHLSSGVRAKRRSCPWLPSDYVLIMPSKAVSFARLNRVHGWWHSQKHSPRWKKKSIALKVVHSHSQLAVG